MQNQKKNKKQYVAVHINSHTHLQHWFKITVLPILARLLSFSQGFPHLLTSERNQAISSAECKFLARACETEIYPLEITKQASFLGICSVDAGVSEWHGGSLSLILVALMVPCMTGTEKRPSLGYGAVFFQNLWYDVRLKLTETAEPIKFLCARASPHLLDVGQALKIRTDHFHLSTITIYYFPTRNP